MQIFRFIESSVQSFLKNMLNLKRMCVSTVRLTNLCINGLISGLIFFWAYSCCFASETSCPVITTVKTPTPIIIDGEIKTEEWKYSACATGFGDIQGDYVGDDTIFYITYDNENIYLAFKSTVSGKPKAITTERDKIKFSNEDVVEFWFQPDPNKNVVYMFAGNAKGAVFDQKFVNRKGRADENNWKWEFKTKVVDSGEMMAGIATFAKSIWTGEVSISFKELGIAAPQPGDQWRVNFCRDWGNKEFRRKKPQWTCWSPTFDSFYNNTKFGYLNFMKKAPAIKIFSFGDVFGGDLQIEGNAFNASSSKKSIENILTLSLAKKEKELKKNKTSLTILPSESTEIKIKEILELMKSVQLKALFVVKNLKDKKIFYRKELVFTARPGFAVEADLYYTKKSLEISIDTRRLGSLSPGSSICADIYSKSRNGEKLIQHLVLKNANKAKQLDRYSCTFNAKELMPGNYIVKGFLKNGKKIIAQSNTEFEMPSKPEWLGNQLGISEKVPSPFEPLKVKGKSVFVWGREYRFDNSIFPSQILVRGKPLLTSGISLNIITQSGQIKWKKSEFKTIYQKETEAKFSIKQTSHFLDLSAIVLIEYDGFIKVDFILIPKRVLSVKNIYLQIPLHQQNALYAKGMKYGIDNFRWYAACLYKGAQGKDNAKTLNLARHCFSAKGWIWPHEFIHYLWVGGDDKGISLSFDSDKNFRTGKYAEIIDKEKVKYIRFNFIDEPLELTGPLPYTVGLQATPVKPLPKDPKRWHFGYGMNNKFDSAMNTTCICWGIKGTGWHEFLNQWTAKNIKKAKKMNIKYHVYDSLNLVTKNVVPAFKYFAKEWLTEPVVETYFKPYKSMCMSVSFKGSYQDHYLWSLNRGIKNGLDMGMYYDVSGPQPDMNIHNGSGYVDKDGKRKPTVNFFETRQGYKRVYTLFKSHNPDAVVFHHTMPPSPLAGFVDVVCEGEELGSKPRLNENYSILTPDFFRVGYGAYQNQYGVPFAMFDGRFFKDRRPFEEGLPLFLIHNTYSIYFGQPSIEALKPIWKILDKWYTDSVWIPYWKTGNLISSFSEKVKISIYQKEKKKKYLMLIANLDYKNNQSGKLKLNPAGLGYGNNKLKITDMMKNEKIPLTGSEFYVSLSANSISFYQLDEK